MKYMIFCYRSQIKGVSKHRKRNPTKAKLILALYAFLSCVVRVTALIAYFGVPLGLFDLLRHLQGLQKFDLLKSDIIIKQLNTSAKRSLLTKMSIDIFCQLISK